MAHSQSTEAFFLIGQKYEIHTLIRQKGKSFGEKQAAAEQSTSCLLVTDLMEKWKNEALSHQSSAHTCPQMHKLTLSTVGSTADAQAHIQCCGLYSTRVQVSSSRSPPRHSTCVAILGINFPFPFSGCWNHSRQTVRPCSPHPPSDPLGSLFYP